MFDILCRFGPFHRPYRARLLLSGLLVLLVAALGLALPLATEHWPLNIIVDDVLLRCASYRHCPP